MISLYLQTFLSVPSPSLQDNELERLAAEELEKFQKRLYKISKTNVFKSFPLE